MKTSSLATNEQRKQRSRSIDAFKSLQLRASMGSSSQKTNTCKAKLKNHMSTTTKKMGLIQDHSSSSTLLTAR